MTWARLTAIYHRETARRIWRKRLSVMRQRWKSIQKKHIRVTGREFRIIWAAPIVIYRKGILNFIERRPLPVTRQRSRFTPKKRFHLIGLRSKETLGLYTAVCLKEINK